jgi:sugar phosphate isomerase/epimerase
MGNSKQFAIDARQEIAMKKQIGLLSRRDCLKLAGAVTLAVPLAGLAAEDLKSKAKKNLKLAIFTGVYASLPLEDAAKKIKADGFSGVVLEYAFADVRFDPFAPDWEAAKKITSCLERNGIKVVGLYGYYNVVAPDPENRKRGEQQMQFLIENWKRLGSNNISTETGSLNQQSEWNDSPENATEKAYQQCRASLEKFAKLAEKTGAVISIEPYWKNVIGSAERAERLFRDIRSPALKLVMDPCNYFRKAELANMQTMLKDIFQRVGKQTVLAHAKDVKGSANADDTELPAAGKGVLDYPLYLRLLAQLGREMYLAVEHLTLPEVPAARDYVLAQFEKI